MKQTDFITGSREKNIFAFLAFKKRKVASAEFTIKPDDAYINRQGLEVSLIDLGRIKDLLLSKESHTWHFCAELGGWAVVKEDAVERILQDGDTKDHVLDARFAFIDDVTWDTIGLPRHEVPERKQDVSQ